MIEGMTETQISEQKILFLPVDTLELGDEFRLVSAVARTNEFDPSWPIGVYITVRKTQTTDQAKPESNKKLLLSVTNNGVERHE